MDYKKIHDAIIERARTRTLLDYKERHHIIPRCMGGDNSPENLVDLTAREHFIVHKLLCEIHPGNQKIFYGYYAMAHLNNEYQKRGYYIGAREFERIRLNHINNLKISMSGRQISEATKQKLRKANLGKKYTRSDEYRRNVSNAHKGKPKTEEHRKNLSIGHLGQIPWNKGKKLLPLTDEQKQKISNSLKGRVVTEETRKKISANHRGKITSEETKQKIRDTKLKNKMIGKHK